MKLKAPEGVGQFYDGAGNEHKPDATGHVITDHPMTIQEMLRAGFTAVEDFVTETMGDLESGLKKAAALGTRLISHQTGNEVGTLAEPPKVGDKLHDDAGQPIQVLSVSEDGKTAVTRPIVQQPTLSDEDKAALETAKAIRETEGPLVDIISKARPLSADEASVLASATLPK